MLSVKRQRIADSVEKNTIKHSGHALGTGILSSPHSRVVIIHSLKMYGNKTIQSYHYAQF